MDVSAVLDSAFEIASRPGLHCAPLAHRTLGTFPHGTVRLSVGYFVDEDQVDSAADAVIQVAEGM